MKPIEDEEGGWPVYLSQTSTPVARAMARHLKVGMSRKNYIKT